MAPIAPDAIGDQLRATCDVLFDDCRTVGLALQLDELRRDIARVLALEPPAPRWVSPGTLELARRAMLLVPPCDTSRREQGAGDGLRIRDLEASVAAHGGRFAEVLVR